MSTYELESRYRIYSDHGFFYEIAPGPDGLGMIELRYFDGANDAKPTSEFSMGKDAIKMLIGVLQQIVEQKD